jgi:[CysO sulfur-carrier protein]-S-L-cysteine hydrolase
MREPCKLMKMIRIKKTIADGLIEHSREDMPIEACGYLAGNNGIISRQYKLANADNSPVHYSFHPEDQFGVIRKSRAEGLKIMACYHSHPSTPARPSQEDIRLAYDQDILYIIISLAETVPDIKAYKISDKKVTRVEVAIID